MENRDQQSSVFVANFDSRVSVGILWELFLQAGPVKSIHIPKNGDKPKTYGFIEFSSRCSAHYACELLDGLKLYDRPLTVRLQNSENREMSDQQPIPRNAIRAEQFYRDFYRKYDELKRRPQSEPRRYTQVTQHEFHQTNHSYNHGDYNSYRHGYHLSNYAASPQFIENAWLTNQSTPYSARSHMTPHVTPVSYPYSSYNESSPHMTPSGSHDNRRRHSSAGLYDYDGNKYNPSYYH